MLSLCDVTVTPEAMCVKQFIRTKTRTPSYEFAKNSNLERSTLICKFIPDPPLQLRRVDWARVYPVFVSSEKRLEYFTDGVLALALSLSKFVCHRVRKAAPVRVCREKRRVPQPTKLGEQPVWIRGQKGSVFRAWSKLCTTMDFSQIFPTQQFCGDFCVCLVWPLPPLLECGDAKTM